MNSRHTPTSCATPGRIALAMLLVSAFINFAVLGYVNPLKPGWSDNVTDTVLNACFAGLILFLGGAGIGLITLRMRLAERRAGLSSLRNN